MLVILLFIQTKRQNNESKNEDKNYKKLLVACLGDREKVQRLIEHEKYTNRFHNEKDATREALESLTRDRSR